MDFTQLRHFVETAHLMHFAVAARELGISQPALSNSIHTLEKELGYRLFDCSNKRKIYMTPAGEVFMEEAEKLLANLNLARRRAKEASSGQSGRLVIGALSSALGRHEVLDALVEMQRVYPHVTLEVIDDNSAGLSSRIKSHTLDLVLTRFDQTLFDNDELECQQLYMDELYVVFRHDHPLATKQDLSIADLSDERIILVPETTSPALHSYIRQLCETHGNFIPIVSDESSSSFTALRLVEVGMGITFVPAAYWGMFANRLVYRQFHSIQTAIPVYAVYPKEQKSILRNQFLSLLKKNFPEQSKSN